jgi:hypothetical protein
MADLNSMFTGGPPWATSTSNADPENGLGGGVDPWNASGNLAGASGVDWSKLGYTGPTTYAAAAGDDSTGPGVYPEFKNWLNNNGYTPGSYQSQPGSADRYVGVLDKSGKPVEGSTYLNHIDDSQFWTGAMLAGGLLSGGVAGNSAFGGLGSAGSGAVSGATTGFGNTGTIKGTLTGAATGGLSGAVMPNVAEYAGIENPTLASAINSGVKSGLSTALQGGSGSQVGTSALTGGALSGLNSLGTQNQMDNYSPLNDINQSSNVSQKPDWYSQDITNAPGGQSFGQGTATYTPYTPQQQQEQQPQSYLDQIKSILGMGNGRVGAGFGGGQGIKYGDLAGGLMQMYQAERSRKNASSLMGSITGNNGAYMKNLQGQLMARDAAAGRRSDVGGRAVQLQSALAQLTANQAPMINNLQNQRENALFSGLQGMYTIGSRGGFFGNDQTQQQAPQIQQPLQQPYLPSTFQQPNQQVDYSLPYQRKGMLGGGQ